MGTRYIAALIVVGIVLALWSGPVLIALIRGEGSKCPRCSLTGIRRTRRRVLEKTLPKFIKPYRCPKCEKRFLVCRSTDYTV